jgi:hypothetical protein
MNIESKFITDLIYGGPTSFSRDAGSGSASANLLVKVEAEAEDNMPLLLPLCLVCYTITILNKGDLCFL